MMQTMSCANWQSMRDSKEKYAAYLASREWAVLKECVKGRSRGVCERCRKHPGENVHHLTYARKYAEDLNDLMHLCRQCHEFISGKSDFDPRFHGSVVFDGIEVNSVYLAGKIKSNWRDQIAPGWSYANESPCYSDDGCLHGEWHAVSDAIPVPNHAPISLTGPFWVDNYGGHGSVSCETGQHSMEKMHPGGGGHAKTARLITWSIRSCDLLFAWIDTPDCHGTIAEIGYAFGLGKIVFVASTTDDCDETWVCKHMANVFITSDCPKSAWSKLIEDYTNLLRVK